MMKKIICIALVEGAAIALASCISNSAPALDGQGNEINDSKGNPIRPVYCGQ